MIHFEMTKTVSNFDFSTTYYYSGPMSGYLNYNIDQFEVDVKDLRDVGIIIESPAENERPTGWEEMTDKALWTAMMGICLQQMNKCQGIIMMIGWPQSRGAVRELEFATERGWPVYFYNNYTLTSMNRKGVN